MPQMYVNPCIVATLGVCYRPSESIIEKSDSREKTPSKKKKPLNALDCNLIKKQKKRSLLFANSVTAIVKKMLLNPTESPSSGRRQEHVLISHSSHILFSCVTKKK